MKSRTGFIQYLQFTAGSNKGGVEQGEVFNDPFRLGQMTPERVNYTAALVVDLVAAAESGEAVKFNPAWTPLVNGFRTIIVDGKEVEFNDNFINRYTKEQLATVKTRTYKVIKANGTVIFANADKDNNVVFDPEMTGAELAANDKVAYKYDNVVIPQKDLPIVNAHMEGIALAAKARRVAIYYSQMAAFQAKTEMGIDLGEVLATQACAELSYEIDTEIVKLLNDNAKYFKDLEWNKALPVGVGKRDWYAGFVEVIEIASQHIYDQTQKHAANYMLAASNIKPILSLIDGWKAASTSKINGPYFAGTLNGIKVYISPAIEPGRYVLGYNGDDMTTSAAVYAPYMAIVPTQLLGFADGAMSQGFSTLYDLKMLNPLLLVAGKVINDPQKLLVTSDESGE